LPADDRLSASGPLSPLSPPPPPAAPLDTLPLPAQSAAPPDAGDAAATSDVRPAGPTDDLLPPAPADDSDSAIGTSPGVPEGRDPPVVAVDEQADPAPAAPWAASGAVEHVAVRVGEDGEAQFVLDLDAGSAPAAAAPPPAVADGAVHYTQTEVGWTLLRVTHAGGHAEGRADGHAGDHAQR
jgi:hypothetical protein